MVPMLMYPADMRERLAQLKDQRAERRQSMMSSCSESVSSTDGGPMEGKVSEYNHPFRIHAQFKLLTHEQVTQQLADISKTYALEKVRKAKQQERRHKTLWLAKVRGLSDKDYTKRPRSVAPEIGEYGEYSKIETVS